VVARVDTSRPCAFIIQLPFFQVTFAAFAHDSPSDLLRFSWLSRLHHTYNEGPGEVREWCMSKIHRQYISILNLPQHESIVVPVACVWSMSNSHILSRTCNLVSSPVPPLGRLSRYSSVSCPGLNYRFPPLTSTLRTPFPSKPYNFSTLESFRIVKLSVYPDSCVPNFCVFNGPVFFLHPQSGHIAEFNEA
jgi:hypothetical protein